MSPLLHIAAVSLLSALACASPHPQADPSTISIDASTITANTTLPVVTVTSTQTATIVPSSSTDYGSSTTSSGVFTQPTSWLHITAARSGSQIHLLPMNAAGSRMYLGGQTISYCPDEVESEGGCPPGNDTVISLCSMVRYSHNSGFPHGMLNGVTGCDGSGRSAPLCNSRGGSWIHSSSFVVHATRIHYVPFYLQQGSGSISWTVVIGEQTVRGKCFDGMSNFEYWNVSSIPCSPECQCAAGQCVAVSGV